MIWTYLPVSVLYILSMTLGYVGLRYIELSISSPICNSSGALVAVPRPADQGASAVKRMAAVGGGAGLRRRDRHGNCGIPGETGAAPREAGSVNYKYAKSGWRACPAHRLLPAGCCRHVCGQHVIAVIGTMTASGEGLGRPMWLM